MIPVSDKFVNFVENLGIPVNPRLKSAKQIPTTQTEKYRKHVHRMKFQTEFRPSSP